MALNNTVNKKKIIEGAAGIGDSTKVAAVAWQNNRAQQLEIEVTNSEQLKNLPFMIENGDLISDTSREVTIKAESNRENKKENKQQDTGMTHD